MKIISRHRVVLCVLSISALTACAGGGNRYPDLNLRDFERVQGTFTSAATPKESVPPESLGAANLAEVENALVDAGKQHARFLSEAGKTRPLVASAVGSGIEDNRWPVAQVAIASLESHNSQTMSLLADLDSLYADASLSYSERAQIDFARNQVADYHAAERHLIAELITLLASEPAGESQ